MNHGSYSETYVRTILETTRIIAMVGASANNIRPSYFVMKYLLTRGFQVIPVNPGQAGKEILGQLVYARLADIPQPIDMVDIFRSPEAAAGVVDDALALDPRPSVIWMQLGVRNDEAAAKAEAAGLKVVMNRCPKIEYGRLSGEIGWIGVNRGLISSRRPALARGKFQRLALTKNQITSSDE